MKKLILVVVVASLALGMFSSVAADTEPLVYGDFEYGIISSTSYFDNAFDNAVPQHRIGTIRITGYIGSGGAIEIPNEINGIAVTEIGRRVFLDSPYITSVNIPESIEHVRGGSFRNLPNLTSIIINNPNMTFGDLARGMVGRDNPISIPAFVNLPADMVRYRHIDSTAEGRIRLHGNWQSPWVHQTIPMNFMPLNTVVYVHYSDILAFVNGFPIRSYNIGGSTFVVAEDLGYFGFNVDWNEENRRLTITPNGEFADYFPYVERSEPGKIAGRIYSTDIRVRFADYRHNRIEDVFYYHYDFIRGYNIGGITLLPVGILARSWTYLPEPDRAYSEMWRIYSPYGGRYTWNPYERTIKLDFRWHDLEYFQREDVSFE